MELEELFLKLGLVTFEADVVTNIPVQNSNTIQIAKFLQTDIGFIYGISTYADSVDPQGNSLITTTQAQSLWLTLKNAATEFGPNIRMDDLLTVFAGVPIVRNTRYLPFRIPCYFRDTGGGAIEKHFDISTTYYVNPTGIVSSSNTGVPPIVIRLKLWYINSFDTSELVAKGMFTKAGMPDLKRMANQ
jgi:hypothetical protein